MTTLIRVFDATGKEARRCDGRCHFANPKPRRPSRCVCGGLLRGIELTVDIRRLDPDYLNWVRAQVRLKPGESVQMEFVA